MLRVEMVCLDDAPWYGASVLAQAENVMNNANVATLMVLTGATQKRRGIMRSIGTGMR